MTFWGSVNYWEVLEQLTSRRFLKLGLGYVNLVCRKEKNDEEDTDVVGRIILRWMFGMVPV
jgi:hypothetical protein